MAENPIDDFLRDLAAKGRLSPGLGKALSNWKAILGGIFFLILLFSSFYQVRTEDVAVVTRFGKFVKTAESGLHLKIPFFDTVIKVPVERQQKMEFGFRTTEPGIDTEYERTAATADESLMLTGDLNLASVEWVVQYRISDPYLYLFKVRNPEVTLRDISESAMRQIIGDRTVNEVLTVGRTEIGVKLEELIQKICIEYSMGIGIDQVVLQDVNPPDQVKAAFNAVNQAQQERETLINQARSEYNKVIPKARGEGEAAIQQAEGYATERVNNAEGDVARFNAIYGEYLRAPDVTKRRIYLETMAKVIPKLGNVIITDQTGHSVLPLLQMQQNLNR